MIQAGAVELQLVDPLQGSTWEDLIAHHPDRSVFHTSAWARVLAGTYHHLPFYVHLRSGSTSIGVVPFMEVRSPLTGTRGVSLPFSDYAPPLIFEEIEKDEVIKALDELAKSRGWRHFEIRGESSQADFRATPSVQFLAHQLDLTRGPAALFQACSSAVRTSVRKAERSGVTVEITTDQSAVEDYYRLHERTRRRHGAPPQPLTFFLRIHEEILRKQRGFVVLARRRSKVIAGAVFLHARSSAVYKFGASDEREQAHRGNNLVMWRAIEFLSERGFTLLHFGRTSLTSESLRRFKLGWGSSESRLSYCQRDVGNARWVESRDKSAGWHTRIFSRLPLSLNRAIGGALYPHLD